MAKSDIFQSALVKKPKRARFDFSHSNTFGMRIGYAYPTEVRFIVPGDDVSVSMTQVARLAPMPVPTFADLKVRHDWFFVPCRLMYNERDMSRIFGSAGENDALPRASLPLDEFISQFSGSSIALESYQELGLDVCMRKVGDPFTPGSLFDFLGIPVPSDENSNNTLSGYIGLLESRFSSASTSTAADKVTAYSDFYGFLENNVATSANLLIEPILAYHYIWRDWYRFTGVQDDTITEGYAENHILSFGDFLGYTSTTKLSDIISSDYYHPSADNSDPNYSDTFGNVFGRLRQVHLSKDVFNSARYGSKPTVLIPTGDSANIPTLREASAIQRFIDLVSIVGSRYYDKVKALFNVKATGFADDRVQFLARYQQFIKVGEVLTTASTDQASTGDYAGRGILIDGKYLFQRHFDEPGWLMCITSVVPDIAYTGLNRQISDTYFVDTPVPALAQIGDQTIFNREVSFSYNPSYSEYNDYSFGDQFRYYAYKSAVNEVHGSFLMSSMRSWVPTQDGVNQFNVVGFSKVSPLYWNKFFNDTTDSPIYGDRFFFKLDFNEFITRQLPKYINYHL